METFLSLPLSQVSTAAGPSTLPKIQFTKGKFAKAICRVRLSIMQIEIFIRQQQERTAPTLVDRQNTNTH